MARALASNPAVAIVLITGSVVDPASGGPLTHGDRRWSGTRLLGTSEIAAVGLRGFSCGSRLLPRVADRLRVALRPGLGKQRLVVVRPCHAPRRCLFFYARSFSRRASSDFLPPDWLCRRWEIPSLTSHVGSTAARCGPAFHIAPGSHRLPTIGSGVLRFRRFDDVLRLAAAGLLWLSKQRVQSPGSSPAFEQTTFRTDREFQECVCSASG